MPDFRFIFCTRKQNLRNHLEHIGSGYFLKNLCHFHKYFYPRKEFSVDESMIPFEERTGLLIYMPTKPTKWGLKA